ncbi:MAG: hypothetical protein DRJ10_02085 [Bacteroidetes bacterium]|nr:MAG: hypothetical protein DRJ10_02085 [Bacteroidota bacterium]
MKSLLKFKIIFVIFILISEGCEKEKIYVNKKPVAVISVNITEGDKPLSVYFNASDSSDPEEEELIYYWDFGDGTDYSGISKTKTFKEIGAFNVILTVTDPKGLEGTDQISIKVNQPPDLFPLSKNAQWVYRVKSTEKENGIVTGDEEGTMYLIVSDLDLSYEYIDVIDLRVTGKKYYNESLLAHYIYLIHTAGKSISIHHEIGETGNTYINLSETSWNNYAMFFSRTSSQSASLSESSINIGLGNFSTYKIRHHRDNWGESYVTERYDITEEEFYKPGIGLIYRETSKYVDFLDCSYCPVYGGGDQIELIGYYIPQKDGTVLQAGTGYNPDNPYGGNLGLLTIWSSVDIGYTKITLDGEYVGTTTTYFPSGATCDQYKAVNVFRPAGTYFLRAESNLGYIWEGNVSFSEGECDMVELLLSKKGLSFKQSLVALPSKK